MMNILELTIVLVTAVVSPNEDRVHETPDIEHCTAVTQVRPVEVISTCNLSGETSIRWINDGFGLFLYAVIVDEGNRVHETVGRTRAIETIPLYQQTRIGLECTQDIMSGHEIRGFFRYYVSNTGEFCRATGGTIVGNAGDGEGRPSTILASPEEAQEIMDSVTGLPFGQLTPEAEPSTRFLGCGLDSRRADGGLRFLIYGLGLFLLSLGFVRRTFI